MSINESSDYEKYLASIHGKLVTPDEVIAETIKRGTGLEVASKSKIVAGEVNEVYDAVLENGKHVIVRVSPNGSPDFQQEVWAIDQVKKLGVPAPKIDLVRYVTVGDSARAICLMEKVEGEPLERGNIDFNQLTEERRRDLIGQAGEILAKIHSVQTNGFGWIIGAGKSEFENADQLIDSFVSKQAEFNKAAEVEDFDQANITQAIKIIESFRDWYSGVKPALNHGDYSHKHFMVNSDKSKVIGIIDWGGVRSDSPVYDFANWDYWFGDYIPTQWLKDGYTNKSLFDDNFEDALHLIRLFKGLEIFHWYHTQNYKPAIEKAKRKLILDLEYFK